MSYSRLFRSRWAALFWAFGICWTAWEVAGPESGAAELGNNVTAQTDATGATYNAADTAALQNAFDHM